MQDLTSHIQAGNELAPQQIEAALAALVDTGVDENEKAAFLKALHDKGETAREVAGFVWALLKCSINPDIDPAQLGGPLLDVCGTGGDRADLFNVSTTTMFVLAAGGAVIAKHGNRGITSKCGGADVLEALGVRIDLPPEQLKACMERTGMGFMFAPSYHPAFQAITPARRRLAAENVPTVFNILGPLLNPAQPPYQLVGVFSRSFLPVLSDAFVLLGRKHAWAVHGASGRVGHGVDEISTMGTTEICEVRDGVISSHTLDPEPLGFLKAGIEALRGGDCAENARILQGILSGEIHGSKRDVVVLNAAAGFVVCDLAVDMAAGIAMAEEQLDSGGALAKLRELQSFS